MELHEFLNLYPQRAPRIMWLLGAGTSASAGVPTAWTLTWEFKRTIYCNTLRIPPVRFPDLNDPGFQRLVQAYFNSQSGSPIANSDNEYSYYFESYLPNEDDRRRFLDRKLQDIRPTYGHFCLAALIALGQVQLVWTTNFDKLLERAYSHPALAAIATHELNLTGLDCPAKATGLLTDETWPVLVKLHGDYRYGKLKNTKTELQEQDSTLQRSLTDFASRRGLAVIGYSGRDHSIIDPMTSILETAAHPFPHGLFWFEIPGVQLRPQVATLLTKAKAKGCQAEYVEIPGFDELMADLFLPHHGQAPEVRDIVKAQRKGCNPVPLSYEGKLWPVLRTNALEIVKYPATCTVFNTSLGGAKEVKEAARGHHTRITAGRRRVGIVAFGTRPDLERVFDRFSPKDFNRHPIEPRKFRHEDSVELGLFYDAVCQALANQCSLQRAAFGKGRTLFFPSTHSLTQAERLVLRQLGTEPVKKEGNPSVIIHEAITIGLEYRDLRLWMLLTPRIVVTTDGTTPYIGEDRAMIGRETLIKRYNRQSNDLLVFWINFIVARCGSPITLSFPTPPEKEAEFQVETITAYSRKVK